MRSCLPCANLFLHLAESFHLFVYWLEWLLRLQLQTKENPHPQSGLKGGFLFLLPQEWMDRPVSGVKHRWISVASKSIFPDATPGGIQKGEIVLEHLPHLTTDLPTQVALVPSHLWIFREHEILQTPLLVPLSHLILALCPALCLIDTLSYTKGFWSSIPMSVCGCFPT